MSSPTELPPTEAHVKAETLPLGELLSDLTRDVSTLMRQEVELAKAELKESTTKAGKGAGMLGGAAYAGHITVLFLSIALWWALGQLVGLGWSAVIVAVIWGIVAAVLAAKGRKELNTIKGMPQTAETVKEIPPALKPNTEETR
ncbi:phage holin family protein [Paenarthrobacter nitroguajacolicus]|uniref:Phage holin family protein n=1 Tax=Paenarthrobacter nitroguajacolicus TaxID=211146 RepID=A0A558GN25_PAENT|nr:phage holin family protein [Paenarthrobacter nitroguajacolicus]TVU58256.1 phage holin family protein [Paenarthrobacter nitroguajacolicus]